MFFRILYPCFLLVVLVISIVASSNRVEAVVASPDSVSVEYAKAFRNVHELNDIVFVCRYYLNYSTEPVEYASDTFIFAITDGTGTIKVQRPLPDDGYGHNAQIIYLSASEVISLGIVWGSGYNAIIMGNPTLFTTTYMNSKFMDASSWIASTTVAAGQTNFKDCLISQSRYLEGVDSSLLLTTNTSSGYKLSAAGVTFWQDRYLGLGDISGVSAVSAQYMTVENQTYTGSYMTDLTNVSNTLSVKESFTALGDTIGIPYWQVIAFGVLMIPSFMIVSGTVYSISGNSRLAAMVAAPVMLVIAMLIPDALLMILTGIAAFIVVAIMWRFV